MGRPFKLRAERRIHQVNVALTAAEYVRVSAAAEAQGSRLVDYARAALLKARVTNETVALVSTVDRLALEQWKRVGANLNQLTRLCHIHNQPPGDDLGALLAEIRGLVNRALRCDP